MQIFLDEQNTIHLLVNGKRNKKFKEIYDLFAIRIIVEQLMSVMLHWE